MKEVFEYKYDNLALFQKDKLLQSLFKEAGPELIKMYTFFISFNGFFPLSKSSLYRRFFQFSILFVFHFLALKSKERENIIVSVAEDEMEDIETINILGNNSRTITDCVVQLYDALLKRTSVFNRDKNSVLWTYANIRKNVDRVKDAEKKKMTDRFKLIKDTRTRHLERDLKRHHIGDYFVDPNILKTYGKKRDQMINTEDVRENDFLFGPQTVEEEVNQLYDDIFGNNDDDNDGELEQVQAQAQAFHQNEVDDSDNEKDDTEYDSFFAPVEVEDMNDQMEHLYND